MKNTQNDLKKVKNGGGRDGLIEAYRCLLMFGIVFLHSMTWSRHEKPIWLWNIMFSCVNAFCIISGWFGIKFKVSKVLRLLGVLAYAMIFDVLTQYSFGVYSGVKPFLKSYLHVGTPWFLYAYLVVMLVAPIINVVFEKVEREKIMTVLSPFFVLLLWSFCTGVPHVSSFVPETPGLGSYTGLTLIGCYVIGRLARYFSLDERLSNRALLLLLGIGLCGSAAGLEFYSSPFPMLIGVASFLLFKRLSLPGWISSLATWAGPSMFAVYLIHRVRVLNGGRTAIGFIQYLQQTFVESWHVSGYAMFIASAIIWFALAVMLDAPRRVLCTVLKPMIKKFEQSVDALFLS